MTVSAGCASPTSLVVNKIEQIKFSPFYMVMAMEWGSNGECTLQTVNRGTLAGNH
jgi:hypothetical protein